MGSRKRMLQAAKSIINDILMTLYSKIDSFFRNYFDYLHGICNKQNMVPNTTIRPATIRIVPKDLFQPLVTANIL